MRRLPVDSSNLASVGFYNDRNVLEIEFRNGRVYQYSDVPEHIFQEILKAESKGQYFNQLIRDRFVYKRIV